MKELKQLFKDKLLSTGREGMETVIEKLEELGFFEAPASTKFHLNVKGGLMEHSWNVCNTALMLREQMIQMKPELAEKLPVESVIIASLLHDVCKSNIYKDAILNRKNDQGIWEKVPGYDVDYSSLPLGHGEKSVIMLLTLGLKLTKDEMLAIRWHMTAWELAFQSPEHMQKMLPFQISASAPACDSGSGRSQMPEGAQSDDAGDIPHCGSSPR